MIINVIIDLLAANFNRQTFGDPLDPPIGFLALRSGQHTNSPLFILAF